MSDQLFIANAPAVVSEIIDGEAIIMSLDSGSYYSSSGVGAAVWSLILERRTIRDIRAAIGAAYDVNDNIVQADLHSFVDRLLSEQLVRAEPLESAEAGAALEKSSEAYTQPEISAYTDMRDLLTLDPIHDTAEAGWPIQKKD